MAETPAPAASTDPPVGTGEAPSLHSVASAPRSRTPRWPAAVGVVVGVLSAMASAWALKPNSADAIAVGSAMALTSVPSGAAFLATAGLTLATRPRPRLKGKVWLVSVLVLLPAVIVAATVVEATLYLSLGSVLAGIGPLLGDGAPAVLFGLLPIGLELFIGAVMGAVAGQWPARIGRSGREAAAKPAE